MTSYYNKVKQKIQNLTDKEVQLQNELIIQKGNTYFVYTLYKIVKTNEGQFDIYYTDGDEYVGSVNQSASAIAWCNAQKGNDIELSNNILVTDRKIHFLQNDINHTKILIKNKSLPRLTRDVLMSRLIDYITKQCKLKANLHKYIQRSKQIKGQGFKNEFTTFSQTDNLTRIR